MKKAFLNWSSGKDAAFALYLLQQEKEYAVEKLVTTVDTDSGRISMHGVRKDLVLRQAEEIGIPLHIIPLEGKASMSSYNRIMERETGLLVTEGFTYSIFGDIFLEDLRAYREQQLQKVGLTPVFPLWKKNTNTLIRDFLKVGFKAVCVSVNAALLDSSFCGRVVDENFLADLPEEVDPCGENGEFHTFVFDGPIFKNPVNFRIGEIVEKAYEASGNDQDDCFSETKKSWDTRFWYCDLLSNSI